MKAILIEFNGKPVAITQIQEISTKQFLDLQKECKLNLEKENEKDRQLLSKIDEIIAYMLNLNVRCDQLQHQINIITGAEESEDQE